MGVRLVSIYGIVWAFNDLEHINFWPQGLAHRICSGNAGYYQFYFWHCQHYWFSVCSWTMLSVSASSTPFDFCFGGDGESSTASPGIPLFLISATRIADCLLRAGQHIHLCNVGYMYCVNFLISGKFWNRKCIWPQGFQIRPCVDLFMVRLL